MHSYASAPAPSPMRLAATGGQPANAQASFCQGTQIGKGPGNAPGEVGAALGRSACMYGSWAFLGEHSKIHGLKGQGRHLQCGSCIWPTRKPAERKRRGFCKFVWRFVSPSQFAACAAQEPMATNNHREALQNACAAQWVLHLPARRWGSLAERNRRGFKLMCTASQSQPAGGRGHPAPGALQGKTGAFHFLAHVAPCRSLELVLYLGLVCKWLTLCTYVQPHIHVKEHR